jgi:glycosyltransferase involved in cell wall biosynthesis
VLSQMKIFDTRWIGSHGIGRFAAELYQRIPGFSPLPLHAKPSSPADPWFLRSYLRSTTPQLFFSPGYNPPLGKPCPFVFCVHDLAHLQVRECTSLLKRQYYRLIVLPALHNAAAVLTVSEFSRDQICEWSGLAASRVAIVGNGISEPFKPEGEYFRDGGRPYLLFVGVSRPHKNFPRLLQAFAASTLQDDLNLIAIGEPPQDVSELVATLGLSGQVSFRRCNDEELASLYRGATAMVFPSLYEGFGLPIVEAMACGTPVLTSSLASMPEIAADAALTVDPLSVEAIADGLKKLVHDDALRSRLRLRGLERARDFTWELTARKVTESLSAVAA